MSPAMSLASIETEIAEELIQHESLYQKGVKNLCENGITKVPKKYILPIPDRPSSENEDFSVVNSNIRLPTIDFAQLQSSNRSEVMASLAKACEEYGFFQLINHGIASDVISHMSDASKRFFELPYEERSKYMSNDMFSPVRYGTSFNQNKDGVFCWRDFLKLSCNPPEEMRPYWPASPVDLRQAAETYSKQAKFLYLMLVEAILESLGLVNNVEGENYLDEFEDGSQLMVVNHYPPCPEPDLTLGIPPHSDYGFLTLLHQVDDVKGLQIQYQGKWVTVEPLANSLVVNVGDHLEIFSNGKYKSVLHRVRVNPSRPRTSIASLHSVSHNRVIRPSPQLINEANPRRYRDTDFATFLEYVSSCEPKAKNFLESRKIDKGKMKYTKS
ncbi:Non-hem dioxygenase N-terminal domain [Dillenia turbinata]|uniref:Non-hem dioxygenase N-terminal domain n=1 Tax=Dillenia turbinata TaxID=194707 RepID=A0AAN8ZD64_9MAGN